MYFTAGHQDKPFTYLVSRGTYTGDAESADPRFAERVLKAAQVPRGSDRGGVNFDEVKAKLANAMEQAAPELGFLVVISLSTSRPVSGRDRLDLRTAVSCQ